MRCRSDQGLDKVNTINVFWKYEEKVNIMVELNMFHKFTLKKQVVRCRSGRLSLPGIHRRYIINLVIFKILYTMCIYIKRGNTTDRFVNKRNKIETYGENHCLWVYLNKITSELHCERQALRRNNDRDPHPRLCTTICFLPRGTLRENKPLQRAHLCKKQN